MTISLNPLSEVTTYRLLSYFSFEQELKVPVQARIRVMDYWLRHFPLQWVQLALVEALYQGRYKVISVQQLLILWHRRGEPVHHFNHEFAALVCRNLSHDALDANAPITFAANSSSDESPSEPSIHVTKAIAASDSAPSASSSTEVETVLELQLEPAPPELLPMTISHYKLEPIHQFMPKAQPPKFCKRLEAIAGTND